MKISKTHQRFSELLEQPDVLTNPEKYLGPNWQDVLNFWIYVDSLSDPEKKEMEDLYWALHYIVRHSAIISAKNAATEVVGEDFRYVVWRAAWNVTRGKEVFAKATVELIGSHKFLEQGNPLTFLPLCIKS